MNYLFKKQDKMYGGYDYIELNEMTWKYQRGNTRAHAGHYNGGRIEAFVPTLKELKEVERQAKMQGYTKEEF